MTDLTRRQSTTTNALAMPKKATLTATGLVVAGDLTGDEWLDIGRVLVCLDKAGQWATGDLLLIHKPAYGDLQARCESINLNYDTARNIMSVSHRVELSRRRDNLTFAHHAAVAVSALEDEEQDALLDEAEAQNWTRDQLRDRVQAKLQLSDGPVDDDRLSDTAGETLPPAGTSDPPDDAVPPGADNGTAGDSLDDRIEAAGQGFDNVMGVLKRLKTTLTELSNLPFGELLAGELASIDRHRKDMYRSIKFSRPVAKCAYCAGSGKRNGNVCRACKGMKWLNERVNEKVIKAMQT